MNINFDLGFLAKKCLKPCVNGVLQKWPKMHSMLYNPI